ncbi:para-aminobenzoate synthetase component 1 [Bacillus mesophilus]|uniref:Anthranilate synthase component I family protein n=1 Tax=Bacillus mesophilus TaxID=1808955 RepID=A0A6M0QCZ0_9BACI|nr:anthranilate synthase component I family protein [Bacillus mesophilus]MBM7663445.1 para-aminobenzoate synthetase component 1 [Bacillus mesophilus]NEY74107.1 anthranilate synthase component I family protein [Bacillus mesophilus]
MSKSYPFYKTIKIEKNDWFPRFQQVSRDYEYHALLESGRGGRYSMFGLEPIAILNGKDGTLEITGDNFTEQYTGNPLHLMKDWMKKFQVEMNSELPFFQGGAIGYISYDYVRYIERLQRESLDDLKIPDLYFLLYNDLFVYDHHEELLYIIACMDSHSTDELVQEKLQTLESIWEGNNSAKEHEHSSIKVDCEKIDVSLTEEEFRQAVEKIQNYISQGDVFQVNLSVRQSQSLLVEPIDVYTALRSINPSPYMAYIYTPEFQIVSGSPELLVKKQGDQVSTRPIAGTRSRGKDEHEDEKLASELIENEKERAEHVMLVDLERNDLGKVCRYGTVEVDEFMVIERYSHVMHIVSNVKGTLFDHYDAYDVIDAVFPGGTITGAPKVRTMEIIEELEPVRRGIYTGSIGWIGYNGDMELNITIRTMLVKDGIAHIQAGAGVVIDSNPISEYKESLKKAKALWKSKEVAEQKRVVEQV